MGKSSGAFRGRGIESRTGTWKKSSGNREKQEESGHKYYLEAAV